MKPLFKLLVRQRNPQKTLTTFNRRIPMSITLPSLDARTLDERYAIISLFIQQEATRLGQQIDIEREAVLAFMLYDAEGNIGQVKGLKISLC